MEKYILYDSVYDSTAGSSIFDLARTAWSEVCPLIYRDATDYWTHIMGRDKTIKAFHDIYHGEYTFELVELKTGAFVPKLTFSSEDELLAFKLRYL